MPKLMRDVIIAIPSYGRAANKSRFCTARHISPKHWKDTVFYVEPEEFAAYKAAYPLASFKDASQCEYPKRWGSIMDLIIDECCPQCKTLIIMDDDLALAVRPYLPNRPTHFEEMSEVTFDLMIDELSAIVTPRHGAPLASGQYRQFSQGKTATVQHNQRVSMIWAMDAEFFATHKEYRFYRDSKLPFMTDYYFFLLLLKHGWPNVCLNKYTKDDKPNASGGESSKRNNELMKQSAQTLERMFPGYVKAYEKQGKGNWQDGSYGVRIQAAKLYRDATKQKHPA